MPRAAGGRFTWRVAILALTLVLGAVGITARLAYIQVINHDHYRQLALEEHSDKQEIRSTRGAILDRNGFPLATSLDVYDIYIDRRTWETSPATAERNANLLVQYLSTQPNAVMPGVPMEPSALFAYLTDPNRDPIELIATSVDYDLGHELEGQELYGVLMAGATKRYYPEGDIGSALLGFLGRDHSGLAGIEADIDSMLAGTPGTIYFERTGAGQPIAFGQTRIDEGVPGSDVRLTIDRYIQRLIETELDYRLRTHSASGGTIIVMDPRTGEILGMASRPSFKLSELSLESPDLSLYRNRGVTDLYEPGSVMKVMTMATALDLGLVTPGTTYFDAGTVDKGGYTFKNWDFSAHGIQTMTQVLQKSLNTGTIWISDLVGANRLYEAFARFGFGESTHSGFGGESEGLVRTNKQDGWYPADLATNSFGQGIAATPLQVITAFSSVINGGNLMRPYFVSEINGPDGRRTYEPTVVRQSIAPETSDTMKEMLNQVVDGVDWHGAQVKGYSVGGKTGTTLVSIPTGYALDSTIASFVGFAPAEDPQFIMLVKIDQPKDDPLGGVVAAPVFGKLAPQILSYLNVPPASQLAITGN